MSGGTLPARYAPGRTTCKIRFDADSVVRFGAAAAVATRSGRGRDARFAAGARAARGDQIAAVGTRRAPALVTSAGRGARGVTRAGAGVLFAAACRGLATRSGSGTRVAAAVRKAAHRAAVTPRPPAARLAVDFRAGVPDPDELPTPRLAMAMRGGGRTASTKDFAYAQPRGIRRPVRCSPAICAGSAARSSTLTRSSSARDSRRGQPRAADAGPAWDAGAGARGSGRDRARIRRVAVGGWRRSASRSTIWASTPKRWRGRRRERSCSLPHISHRPAWSWLPSAGRRSPPGPTSARRRSSRTTTTPSFATTVIRSERSRGLAPDRVALIGTVSKSLAPTLRLGLGRVPAEHRRGGGGGQGARRPRLPRS